MKAKLLKRIRKNIISVDFSSGGVFITYYDGKGEIQKSYWHPKDWSLPDLIRREPYYVGGCRNGGWSCGCLGDIIANILGIYQYKSILHHENRWKKRTLLKAIKRRNKAVIYKFKDN